MERLPLVLDSNNNSPLITYIVIFGALVMEEVNNNISLKRAKKENIYLDDTVETIQFEKDALEVKFKHNINELAAKNVRMSGLFRDIIREER